MFGKKKFWVLAIYVALLAASFGVRFFADPPKAAPGKKFAEVSIEGETPVRIAYKEFGQSAENESPVVMIHGSPGSAEAFDGLAAKLPNRHIISIDLPGFGDSTRDIPDYSIAAHAEYLQAFLKERKVNAAHLVGFSLGGGVILHAADNEPELARSITFVSSIGVQEYELFGDYYLNHVVHGLQLGFAWVLRELTPHFGLFDGGMIEYSRNFFDTDQRPLKKLLREFDGPMLILHGKDDPLVPVEAAREHARIVPQSEYHELNDNHFFIFMRPDTVTERLTNFWNGVEQGNGVKRADARQDRKNAAADPFEFKIVEARGPAIFGFFLLLLVVAIINEDIAAVLAGVFIAQGRFGPVMPALAITLVILVSGYFWRRIGRRRRGITLKSSFPFSIEPQKAHAFGFRFLDYINRSRDSFLLFTGLSIGLGLIRFLAIGAVVYFVLTGMIFGGIAGKTNTMYLLGMGALIYVLKSVIFLFFIKRDR